MRIKFNGDDPVKGAEELIVAFELIGTHHERLSVDPKDFASIAQLLRDLLALKSARHRKESFH